MFFWNFSLFFKAKIFNKSYLIIWRSVTLLRLTRLKRLPKFWLKSSGLCNVRYCIIGSLSCSSSNLISSRTVARFRLDSRRGFWRRKWAGTSGWFRVEVPVDVVGRLLKILIVDNLAQKISPLYIIFLKIFRLYPRYALFPKNLISSLKFSPFL